MLVHGGAMIGEACRRLSAHRASHATPERHRVQALNDPYVIVWDLDLTLGDFSALSQRPEGSAAVTVRVRPGIAAALRTLSEAGFLHTLLTLATPLYAEMVLRATGLRQFFSRVEGLTQRMKGDAAGIAADLGIGEHDRPHRMLFVGDHPLFDAPQDHRVLFHLEPFALSRPAAELTRLVLHLRAGGRGSLRQGFDRLARQRAWWKKLWPARWPGAAGDQPVRRLLPGVGELLLLACAERCPVIGFGQAPEAGQAPAEHSFVPAEVMAQVEAERSKGG
jgi:hypothetical protein